MRFGHDKIVRLLLEQRDIDIHSKMRFGRKGKKAKWVTPLEAAQEAGPESPIYRVFAERGLLPEKSSPAPVVPETCAMAHSDAPIPRPQGQ